MNNWESRKASIKRHQLPFLQNIANKMGYYSISDAVDYALSELKRLQLEQKSTVNIQNIQDIVPGTALNSQPKSINLDNVLGDLYLD